MRKVSLEWYYFVLYNGALTLEMSKMALNPRLRRKKIALYGLKSTPDVKYQH